MWRILVIFFVAIAGFWFGKTPVKPALKADVHPEKVYPVSERKSFVIVVYAYNESLWCERALRSIFEQEYDHYRVVLIDDGSTDGTGEKAIQFINDNNQKEKVIFIKNETRLGEIASLYRAIDFCLDREIVVPLLAKDWFSSPLSFSHLNLAYQNPDVWVSLSAGIDYPSYEISSTKQNSFYAALFKQIRLADLYKNGHFALHADAYLKPLIDLSGGRVRKIEEPITFSNTVSVHPFDAPPFEAAKYPPLENFPKARYPTAADILIFSSDRPMELYACLESVQRYITGFERLTVLYQASNGEFAAGYEIVKNAFPVIDFVLQENFKSDVEKVVFESPSEYILFGTGGILVKDFVDLKSCMQFMEKTGAYGFYLGLGQSIHQSLAAGVCIGDCDGEDNSLDMTLFKKESIGETLVELKYKDPSGLALSKEAIGLYFEHSKLINPMNDLSTDELLAKFNQGFKIDIDPLYKIESASPKPQFVMR